MKLLFVQGGSRIKEDSRGNLYTDGNLNNKIWNRYKAYCDELIILLRSEDKIYSYDLAIKKFNPIDLNNVKIIRTIDLMRPKYRFVSFKYRRIVKKQIEDAVKMCDKAIIRSAHNFYTLNAIKYCKKYNKPYLIEIAGYAFDGYWNHGDLFGKLFALPYELLAKKSMRNSKYCVYVTNYSLQNRYPCFGKSLGCSDVEILNLDRTILKERLNKISKKNDSVIRLGTIGWLNLKLKGQHDVIKALGILKRMGINNFEYQLVGLGNHDYLDKLIKKYDLTNEVKIVGSLPHDEIFTWLKEIDFYIQPSYTEGLCRAVVEAMSMACPVIVSDAGGNPELASLNYIYKKGNISELINILKNINKDELIKEANRSFETACLYDKNVLDRKRDAFYFNFINDNGDNI